MRKKRQLSKRASVFWDDVRKAALRQLSEASALEAVVVAFENVLRSLPDTALELKNRSATRTKLQRRADETIDELYDASAEKQLAAENELRGKPLDSISWDFEGITIGPYLNSRKGQSLFSIRKVGANNDWKIRQDFRDERD